MLRAILLAAATTWLSRPSAFLRRLRVARLYGRRRLRRLRARRTEPDFDEVGVTIATIDDGNPSRVDSTLIHEIVHRATAEHIRLACTAGPARVDDDVSLITRRALQFNREVIQTGLSVIKGHRLKLVEGLALDHGWFLRH